MSEKKRMGRPRKQVEETEPVKEEQEIAESTATEETPVAEEQGEVISEVPLEAPYNPLEPPVKHRDYTRPAGAVEMNGENIPDIPEPSFTPPPISSASDNPQMTPPPKTAGGQPQAAPTPPLNPIFNELDNKEKALAAEQLVDAALEGYDKLHALGRWYVEVPEEELMEMAMDGKISLDLEIPVNEDGTETVTLQEFIGNYNSQAKAAIVLSESFKTKVRPAMIRVFSKKGWGMSDEQFLMTMFAQDMVTKGAIVFSLKGAISKSLAAFTKVHKAMEESKGKTVAQKRTPTKSDDVITPEILEPEER